MEPPAITRHRRPFLAPLWLTLLAIVVIGAVAVTFYRSATTTVVLLVRPVEKQPGSIDDPPLSPEGEQRAQRLAQMLGDGGAGGGLEAIYVSDDRRAQQTAAPLAQRLHRAPQRFSARDARTAAARVLGGLTGGTVLVMGGGATGRRIILELRGGGVAAPAGGETEILYVFGVAGSGRSRQGDDR